VLAFVHALGLMHRVTKTRWSSPVTSTLERQRWRDQKSRDILATMQVPEQPGLHNALFQKKKKKSNFLSNVSGIQLHTVLFLTVILNFSCLSMAELTRFYLSEIFF
jgi:hypothetical protein